MRSEALSQSGRETVGVHDVDKNHNTRHRASTSMYSLTFRVASPAQYGRNGTASLQITSHTPNLHVDFIAGACVVRAACVRWAWRITAGLCHAFP